MRQDGFSLAVLPKSGAMERVKDDLGVADLERWFNACPGPAKARHVQAIRRLVC